MLVMCSQVTGSPSASRSISCCRRARSWAGPLSGAGAGAAGGGGVCGDVVVDTGWLSGCSRLESGRQERGDVLTRRGGRREMPVRV